MTIFAGAGDNDSMGLAGAALLGLFFVVMPQILMLNHVCSVSRMNFPRAHLWLLIGVVFGGLALLVVALHTWGAKEVRTDAESILFLAAVGGVWQITAMALFPWLGLSIRDDAMERHNRAALIALLGALVAVQVSYICGNIGEGPSYWNNVFSAGLATGGLILLWLALQIAADISGSVAEERDVASGIRFCGFMLACGLIFGRAVAGDWVSESATVHDFARDGWPAVALCAVSIPVERVLRPSRQKPFPSPVACGVLPALGYLCGAGVWLCHLGMWDGFSK
jgi:hypothetical protein